MINLSFYIKIFLKRVGILGLISTILIGLPFSLSILKGSWLSATNLFSLGGLTLTASTFSLCLILALYGRTVLHKVWLTFNFVIGLWGIGAFFLGQIHNPNTALILLRVIFVPIIFIPILNYHFIYELCHLKNKIILQLIYVQGIIFSILSLYSSSFIPSVRLIFNSFYYAVAGRTYYVFFIIWIFIIAYTHFQIFYAYIHSKGRLKTQILYLFVGTIVGFAGGTSNYLPNFGINLYPFGNFTIPLYCFIVSYAVMKYQLLDIKVTITRVGTFIIVYSFILGIPFGGVIWEKTRLINYLGENWFWVPMLSLLILATAGPFIYLYVQKKAEDRLLQEQRRYQATLRQASAGMGRIKDLKKLLNMIVYVLTHAVQIEHALIYILNLGQKKYVLGASKRKSDNKQFMESIEKKSPLIQYFLQNKTPIIFEEIKQKAIDFNDSHLVQIEQIITSLDGELLVPIFIDQDLTAIIVMGKKESGKPYSEDDLGVFSILANQTALAIENAQFYEEMNLTHEQLFQAEKMATIGTMADGLSHQINNRFHALGFIAGDALDTIHLNQKEMSPDKMKEVMAELERAFVRVQENVVQGGEIVQGLLRYTRKGEAGFTAVEVDAVFKAALEMVQFKIKTHELKIIREYDAAAIPKIKGNFTQLQEVFFNLIDNGYDAMMQRKNEAKEEGYQPTLIVRVLKEDNVAQIIFEDNGMGVKDEDMHKLFTPFFTTKLSSKKGTGLGLYVIKKIVEDNHSGKVEMISKYMHGTQMKLRLPIAIG